MGADRIEIARNNPKGDDEARGEFRIRKRCPDCEEAARVRRWRMGEAIRMMTEDAAKGVTR